MEISKDYTGRQVDLEALQTVEQPDVKIRLSKSMTSDNKHRRITGVQKLVQRYAVLFLSGQGTTRFAPSHGTDFVQSAQQGSIGSRESVVHYFSFANLSVRENLLREVGNTTFGDQPDDELFDRANLLDYVVDSQSGYLYLKVQIFNVAGDEAQFIIPVQ